MTCSALALLLLVGACNDGEEDAGIPDARPARDTGGLDAARDADLAPDAPSPESDSSPTADGSIDAGEEADASIPCLEGALIDDCDDHRRCTLDSCDRSTGTCVHLPDDSFCTDAHDCTTDICDPESVGFTGCVHLRDHTRCGATPCGASICDPEGGCVSPSCDDGNPCTADACSSAAGGCVGLPIDADGDGAPAAAILGVTCAGGTDCDDDNPTIAPSAVEACNGADDNCDGVVDDGFECRTGSEACRTSCGSSGTRTCAAAACRWGDCAAPTEICNGIDDDCDGLADEGFDCTVGAVETCALCLGVTPGTRTCSPTCDWTVCIAPELCNGMDDDCDLAVDEGFDCRAGQRSGCTTACGSPGVRLCAATCTWDACVPPLAEMPICNGIDDDCDGMIDEGIVDYRQAGPSIPIADDGEWPAVTATARYFSTAYNAWLGAANYSAEFHDTLIDGTGSSASRTILPSGEGRHPDIAWNGTSQVAYAYADEVDGEVYLRRSYETGLAMGTVTRVSSSAIPSIEPVVAFGGGLWMVVWREDDEIVAQRVGADGVPLGSRSTVTTSGRFPDIAWSGSEWGVVWQTPAPTGVRFRRVGTDGLPIGGEVTVTATGSHPSMVWAGSGYHMFYWQSGVIRRDSVAADGSGASGVDAVRSVPLSSAFTGVATNGSELGLCYDTGSATRFAVFTLDGRSVGSSMMVSNGLAGCDVAVSGTTWGVTARTADGGLVIARFTPCGR